ALSSLAPAWGAALRLVGRAVGLGERITSTYPVRASIVLAQALAEGNGTRQRRGGRGRPRNLRTDLRFNCQPAQTWQCQGTTATWRSPCLTSLTPVWRPRVRGRLKKRPEGGQSDDPRSPHDDGSHAPPPSNPDRADALPVGARGGHRGCGGPP